MPITTLVISRKSKSSIVPGLGHVVIVIEENRGYDQIIGTGNAPYFDSPVKEEVLFTNSQAITLSSQLECLAIFSGSQRGITDDSCIEGKGFDFTFSNLGAALFKAGYAFNRYSETLPSDSFEGCYYTRVPGYPFVQWHDRWVKRVRSKRNKSPLQLSKSGDVKEDLMTKCMALNPKVPPYYYYSINV